MRAIKEIESILISVMNNELYFDKLGFLNSDGKKMLYRISYYLGDLCGEARHLRRFYRRALKEPSMDNLIRFREALEEALRRLGLG